MFWPMWADILEIYESVGTTYELRLMILVYRLSWVLMLIAEFRVMLLILADDFAFSMYL